MYSAVSNVDGLRSGKKMEQATKKDPAAADTEADAEEVSGTAAVHRKMEGEFISLRMMAQP